MADTVQPVLAPERAHPAEASPSGADPHRISAFSLRPPSYIPRRYKPRGIGEWSGHLTFSSELIAATEPALIVELGTYLGESYFTFCQTIQERGLNTVCYAVDHWMGDEHAGFYGEEIYAEVSQHNDRLYRQFSYLLRRSFDDAVTQFADDSIDLLHIDGLHTYDAVKHDFNTWLPKVKPGGIVLLHDIVPRHQDFGVWRLWDELKSEFPETFEFHHSWGLGVLRKPGASAGNLLLDHLFHSSPAVCEDVRRHYVTYASHVEHLLGPVPAPPKIESQREIIVQVFPRIDGNYAEANSQIRKMNFGDWHTLMFDLRNPSISGPLRIDPGSEPSIIEVGDVLIHSTESGELIWSSLASAEHRDFQITGTARPHPDRPSVAINAGDDPVILLNTQRDVHGPLKLTITLKALPAADALKLLQHDFVDVGTGGSARRESERLSAQVASLCSQLEQVKLERDENRRAAETVRAALAHEQDRITQIQHSLSWRITAPIRTLMTLLRGGPRKN